MGEPAAPEAAVAEAATSERDVLLATKLNVPGLRPDLVPRPRLAQRLDEGQGRGLVLACAPAGYGKTVLLAEWIRRGRHRVAWLSLDAGDNDPARFWRHAVAALDRTRPWISERMGPLLGPLCDAVTGRPGSQALLEEAERAGLFVVPLDEVRGWWRYHHLEMLAAGAANRTEAVARARELGLIP
jgi:ATP/maltotriose-dependent transcriptional regulator MalT